MRRNRPIQVDVRVRQKGMKKLMAQIDDLRAAIAANQAANAQILTDIGEATVRIQARLDALGQPDPDLSADLAAIQSATAQAQQASAEIDALVADSPPPDSPPPDSPPPDTGPPTSPPVDEGDGTPPPTDGAPAPDSPPGDTGPPTA